VAQPQQLLSELARDLPQALAIQPGDLVALVGGGGKTSLMLALGRALAAAGQRAVLTTTTRIAAHELELAPATCEANDEGALAEALATHGCCLLAQPSGAHKAAGVSPDVPRRLLARPDVDVVVVEADGAAQRPVKAPAAHEPALPDGTTLLVVLVGIDALAAPIGQVAHRPERVAALAGLGRDERLTPGGLARLVTHEDGGIKSLPAGARAALFINKVEDEPQSAAAAEVAAGVLASRAITRVVAGALQDTSRALRIYTRRAPARGQDE
jgi:probable selenium-dependent hydroxylase accessory protein YqeC